MEEKRTLVAGISGMDIFHQKLNGKRYWSVEKNGEPIATLVESFEGAVKEAVKSAGLLEIVDRG